MIIYYQLDIQYIVKPLEFTIGTSLFVRIFQLIRILPMFLVLYLILKRFRR